MAEGGIIEIEGDNLSNVAPPPLDLTTDTPTTNLPVYNNRATTPRLSKYHHLFQRECAKKKCFSI